MVLDGGWGWYWRVVGGGIGEQAYLEFHEICEGVCGIYLYMRMYMQKETQDTKAMPTALVWNEYQCA